ncbi:MAG TPA: hypothetical protein VF104_00200 [Burkholderiales bacterium]
MKMPILRPSQPCPFCAWPASGCYADEVYDNQWTVICGSCGANGPIGPEINSPGKALLHWDARPEVLVDPEAKAALQARADG